VVDIIDQISQTLLDQFKINAVLKSFMERYRGERTSGLIEWLPSMPQEIDGRFEINDTDVPYVRICRSGAGFITQPDPSFKADIVILRRILGVLTSYETTYEGDEDLKGFYVAVWRALYDDSMQIALQALGIKQTRVSLTDVDGLSTDPHSAFIIDVAFTVDGGRFMR